METWYLAHQLKNRRLIRQLQKKLEAEYKVFLLNPFYDTGRVDVLKLDSGEIKSRYDFTLDECKKTVDQDLYWIRQCDAILCILMDKDALGSYMEIFYASKILDKPVYIVCPVETVTKHLWIRALCYKIFNSIKELESYFLENGMLYD
jgi:hypothetical protein